MAIVRASTEDVDKLAIARHQLMVCHEGGLRLRLYGWLYLIAPDNPMDEADGWLRVGEGYPVETVYVDCEDKDDPGPYYTVEFIRLALSALDQAGMRAGIYTGRPWWINRTGNSSEFKGRPLWHANYDERPVLDWGLVNGEPMQPYGGWLMPEARQYTDQLVLAGKHVSLSVIWA